MSTILLITLFSLFISSCVQSNISDRNSNIAFNKNLANELDSMAKIDQIAAYIPIGEYKNLNADQWESFKDSVFRIHQLRLADIFDKYGYPGFDLVGENGELNFWVMTQHCDFNPEFQSLVLQKLKIEVDKKNADGRHYALLLDRVNLNTNKKQIYGTQVTYSDLGQAYPKNLSDSIGVDQRRIELGLDSLIPYLNLMTTRHFEMNKEYFENKGIMEPMIYGTN